MAFEGPFAKVWVNVCDSLQKLGNLVSVTLLRWRKRQQLTY